MRIWPARVEAPAKRGRIAWERSEKRLLNDERQGLLVIRIEPELGRCHAIRGVSASYKTANIGLLTVLSSNRPVRMFRYVHTSADITFPAPIVLAPGEDALICLSRGQGHLGPPDPEDDEPRRGPVLAATLTAWGYTDDAEE